MPEDENEFDKVTYNMKIIPLKGVSNYDVVEVTWSKKSEGISYDFSQGSKNRRLNSLNVRNKSNQVTAQLPTYEHWDEKWGAVMRVQAISYNAGDVNLRDLDGNARTVFLSSRLSTNWHCLSARNERIDVLRWSGSNS